MITYSTVASRLVSAALSLVLALVSIAIVTDTAIARPQHIPAPAERADERGDESRLACTVIRGPGHRPARNARPACEDESEVNLASSRVLVRE